MGWCLAVRESTWRHSRPSGARTGHPSPGVGAWMFCNPHPSAKCADGRGHLNVVMRNVCAMRQRRPAHRVPSRRKLEGSGVAAVDGADVVEDEPDLVARGIVAGKEQIAGAGERDAQVGDNPSCGVCRSEGEGLSVGSKGHGGAAGTSRPLPIRSKLSR